MFNIDKESLPVRRREERQGKGMIIVLIQANYLSQKNRQE